jgi:pilus assembly protein Flp/PilA
MREHESPSEASERLWQPSSPDAPGGETDGNFSTKEQTKMIKRFLKDESGLELSEYAVAAALVALAVITAFTTLGTNIGAKINNLATKIGS